MAVLVKAFGDKPWKDDELLECAMVVPETSDTATFTFRAPSGAWFDYQPGQFVTLDLPTPGGNVPSDPALAACIAADLGIGEERQTWRTP